MSAKRLIELLQAQEKAQKSAEFSPDRKVVLLIDEINRATLPRVF